MYLPNINEFPNFSLKRLLSTCFGDNVAEEQKICILIDLPDLSLMKEHKFLELSDFLSKNTLIMFFLKNSLMEFHKAFPIRVTVFLHSKLLVEVT